ncbi:MAG: hypothetical protein ACREHG_05085 [Candidatus Saccharimonadales bacterium]
MKEARKNEMHRESRASAQSREQRSELAALRRREQRTALEGARCACGETDRRALMIESEPLTCYQCAAKRDGKSGVERHHVAGRHNSPVTIAIPANDHRILSDLQQDWSRRTLQNPEGSPLLAMAAMLRGWLDIIALLIERSLGRIPAALETLDASLVQLHGTDWYTLPAFAAFRGMAT